MTGTPAAAVFFSLLAVLLIFLGWAIFDRSLRDDLLRWRLYLLREEIHRLSLREVALVATPEYSQVLKWLSEAERNASKVTCTRMLLCACWLYLQSHAEAEKAKVPEELRMIRARMDTALFSHAFPGWGFLQRFFLREGLLEAVLASARSAAVDQPLPPENGQPQCSRDRT